MLCSLRVPCKSDDASEPHRVVTLQPSAPNLLILFCARVFRPYTHFDNSRTQDQYHSPLPVRRRYPASSPFSAATRTRRTQRCLARFWRHRFHRPYPDLPRSSVPRACRSWKFPSPCPEDLYRRNRWEPLPPRSSPKFQGSAQNAGEHLRLLGGIGN